MKKTFLLLYGVCFSLLISAQAIKKYPVGDSGCSVYLYSNPGDFVKELSEDSSDVYTGATLVDSVHYDVICVKLLSEVTDIDQAEELLASYLDFLKKNFGVQKAAGYGKGHRLQGNENTRGIVDYWEDAEGYNWKIKGWTDGQFIAVLMAYSQKELPETKINVFLDGFRLPGL